MTEAAGGELDHDVTRPAVRRLHHARRGGEAAHRLGLDTGLVLGRVKRWRRSNVEPHEDLVVAGEIVDGQTRPIPPADHRDAVGHAHGYSRVRNGDAMTRDGWRVFRRTCRYENEQYDDRKGTAEKEPHK